MPRHEAKAGISWVFFYNTQRFPQALGNRTPMAVCREGVSDAPGGGLSEYPLPKAVIGALG